LKWLESTFGIVSKNIFFQNFYSNKKLKKSFKKKEQKEKIRDNARWLTVLTVHLIVFGTCSWKLIVIQIIAIYQTIHYSKWKEFDLNYVICVNSKQFHSNENSMEKRMSLSNVNRNIISNIMIVILFWNCQLNVVENCQLYMIFWFYLTWKFWACL